MIVLVTCKNEEDPIKNKGSRVLTRFPIVSLWEFFSNAHPASHQNILNSSQIKDFLKWSRAANSAVHGWIWPNYKLVRDIMDVLHTCKNEEDPIKNEGARVLTRLYVVFSDPQGQLTPKSAVEFR